MAQQQIPNPIELYEAVSQAFVQAIRGVRAGQMSNATPGSGRVLGVAKSPDELEEELDTPFGPLPGDQLIIFPFLDLLLHRWDLFKGTAQATTMDSGLAEVCYNMIEPLADGSRQTGGFGPAVAVHISTSMQYKLLGITGRDP